MSQSHSKKRLAEKFGIDESDAYNSDDFEYVPEDATATERKMCLVCGRDKFLPVESDRDRRQVIRFACKACRKLTLHASVALPKECWIHFDKNNIAEERRKIDLLEARRKAGETDAGGQY